MGLNFKKWILAKLGGDLQQVTSEEMACEEFWAVSADLHIRELAFWSCVHLVAKALCKCEFRTFDQGKECKGPEYYLWNVAPNKNQNSSEFILKWISQLYRYGHALVVESGGDLVVADAFCVEEYALYENIFSGVRVGDFTFSRTFRQSEVLYLRLSEKNMRKIANCLYASYQKLIDYGMNSYLKSRGTKGILEVDAVASGDAATMQHYNDLKNKNFKSFAQAESAVLPMYRGLKYTDLGSKTYSNEATRDIRAMMNDVSDFTAKAFGIPPALLSGEVQDTSDAMQQFLTFCLDPLADMVSEEINRKRYGQQAFCQGTYLRIDTKCIQHVDLLRVSESIDKLIASGAFCVNDIRKLTGEAPIPEPWANQHFMTKNYENLKTGGEPIET